MPFQPLLGWRDIGPTARRTAEDFAEVLRWRAEDRHPDAGRLVRVTDNRNTHTPAGRYEAFDPVRARRIAERRAWHYTPKPGSWRNLAEVEVAALSEQCPDRRIGSMARLRREVAAWGEDRNERMGGVSGRFATPDARIRLRSLYPPIKE